VIALAILFTMALGTVGFVVIEGYPVFDAFYMTLTTVTTWPGRMPRTGAVG